jgi:hypothetical protein
VEPPLLARLVPDHGFGPELVTDADEARDVRVVAEVVRCEWLGGRWRLETANSLRDAVDG